MAKPWMEERDSVPKLRRCRRFCAPAVAIFVLAGTFRLSRLSRNKELSAATFLRSPGEPDFCICRSPEAISSVSVLSYFCCGITTHAGGGEQIPSIVQVTGSKVQRGLKINPPPTCSYSVLVSSRAPERLSTRVFSLFSSIRCSSLKWSSLIILCGSATTPLPELL